MDFMQLPQVMGYDRASTLFSPDGRLLQVEYARTTVKQSPTAIGMLYKTGVLVIGDKKIVEKFVIPSSIEKVYIVDDHVIAAPAGIIGDGRVLIERARVIAQTYKYFYGHPIDIRGLVKEIADIKQEYTQIGGVRPFGVSIIFAGIDDTGKHIFVTEPGGMFWEYKLAVIGEGEQKVLDYLGKEYNENLSLKKAIELGLKALYNFYKENNNELTAEKLDIAYVDEKTKKAKYVDVNEIEKILEKIKSGGNS
ncbi:NEQ521 [Nanoarchaeum equitans Kin4-M]|uniref:NEQ521 n=1 Tax=Nanoarchaeum equitans (strain Kin4-M) TaxID=228908 RepID=Q74M45_NANEQ|nr:NEQ521 [Nanoarchaeum equitans Kin4-M]